MPIFESSQQFLDAVGQVDEAIARNGLNEAQTDAVFAPVDEPLIIVAGPGSGKTTVLVLRLLAYVFLHDVEPQSIIATTFTRKAAAELRSRILGWGYRLREIAKSRCQQDGRHDDVTWLESRCELGDVTVDTLDAIAQDLVARHVGRDEVPPVTIEQLAANSIMLSNGVFGTGGHQSDSLANFIETQATRRPNVPGRAQYLRALSDRIANDRVDIDTLTQTSNGAARACNAVRGYRDSLRQRNMADFSMLSERFLELLEQGAIDESLADKRVLLVDEFQDTNLLQESIYFTIASRIADLRRSHVSLTVVGDDDQSVFRFRGATVEIFTQFGDRLAERLGLPLAPVPVFLRRNYRSTELIVRHCNEFVADPGYTPARVQDKPGIIARDAGPHDQQAELPVLGIFDDSRPRLAERVATFIHDVFRGQGVTITFAGDRQITLHGDPERHDVADAVLLSHTTREIKEGRNDPLNLSGHLRRELGNHLIQMFNPRGRQISHVPEVRCLLGLFLECIDPRSRIQESIPWLHGVHGDTLRAWRTEARAFARSDPAPGGLQQFLTDWAQRPWRAAGRLRDWPALELVFSLVTWIPRFLGDPEYQTYLEAVTRTIEQASPLSGFTGLILFDDNLADPSVKHLLQYVIAPIAAEEIDVDEDLMPHVPRSWFPVMTIHQSKGLEFPLVLVDVGSGDGREIKDFLRFPTRGSTAHRDEDLVGPHSPLGDLRGDRAALDRARDDIKREYFVAFSRAQSVLVMVGHTRFIDRRPLASIPAGSRYDQQRIWQYLPAARVNPAAPGTVALI